MGRDCYNVTSEQGAILRELRSERRCRDYIANRDRNQLNRRLHRERKLRVIEGGVKLVLSRGRCDVDWLRHYADNFERFPEIRHYAADVIHVAHTDGRFSLARARAIEHLNNVIRKFKDK